MAQKFLLALADVMFILLAGIVLITYLPGVIGFKSYRVLQPVWSLNYMSVVLCM